MTRPGARGASLVELLVGTALGMTALAALTASIACGGRMLVRGAARGELEDVAHLAVEALTFDVRRAGFDPTLVGVQPLVEAATDHVILNADLDGDGVIDDTSEEKITWTCSTAQRKLSRLVGRQSLPLADGVTACAFRYLDATGTALPVPAAGLALADRARVRAVALDVTIAGDAVRAATRRQPAIALRTPG